MPERHGVTHRNYGEFVFTEWCDSPGKDKSPASHARPAGRRLYVRASRCRRMSASRTAAPSPWPWPIPLMARDVPTKPELKDHFDPHYPDFRIEYPDQLRVDEFLNEFDAVREGAPAQRRNRIAAICNSALGQRPHPRDASRACRHRRRLWLTMTWRWAGWWKHFRIALTGTTRPSSFWRTMRRTAAIMWTRTAARRW